MILNDWRMRLRRHPLVSDWRASKKPRMGDRSMRRVRNAMIAVLVLLGTAPALRAQMAHGPTGGDCGCSQEAGCDECGGCQYLLPALAARVHCIFDTLLPCRTGCATEDKIYQAALNRQCFRRPCCFPCIPLISYRRNPPCAPSCGCGSTSPAGGEIMEMQEMPGGLPIEPTPALQPEPNPIPPPPKPDASAGLQHWKDYQTARTSAARTRTPATRASSTGAPRVFVPVVARKLSKPASRVQTVSGVEHPSGVAPSNPLRR